MGDGNDWSEFFDDHPILMILCGLLFMVPFGIWAYVL